MLFQISFVYFLREGETASVSFLIFYNNYNRILLLFQISICFCRGMRRQNLTLKVKFPLQKLNFYLKNLTKAVKT